MLRPEGQKGFQSACDILVQVVLTLDGTGLGCRSGAGVVEWSCQSTAVESRSVWRRVSTSP